MVFIQFAAAVNILVCIVALTRHNAGLATLTGLGAFALTAAVGALARSLLHQHQRAP